MTKRQPKQADVPAAAAPTSGEDPGLAQLLADRDRAYAEQEQRLPAELQNQARQREVDEAGRARSPVSAATAVRELQVPARSGEAVRAREAARAGGKSRKGGSRRGRK